MPATGRSDAAPAVEIACSKNSKMPAAHDLRDALGLHLMGVRVGDGGHETNQALRLERFRQAMEPFEVRG